MYDEITEKCQKYSFLLDFGDPDIKTVKRFVRGDEEYLYDEEGKRYLDLSSQFVNNSLGYDNKKIIEAIHQQLSELHYVKPISPSKPRAELCEKIITEIAPDNMEKVFLTLGGSDANDLAVRMAILATGRSKIMSQYGSYHGATFGAANLSGGERLYENLETHHFVHFLGYNNEKIRTFFDDEDMYVEYLLTTLEEQIRAEGWNKIAAVFLETISLGSSFAMPPLKYYQGVRKICDKYGILLIFDEVIVGFGRTGKWFAFEHYNVKPDLIVMAKGITSSYYPVGGVLASHQVSQKLMQKKFAGVLTSSYHPVGCAAALASIQEMQDRGLIKNAEVTGKYLGEQLQGLADKHTYIREIRGIGLLYGILLTKELERKQILFMICEKLYEKGYYTWVVCRSILIAPPITIRKEQIDNIVEALDEIFRELEESDYMSSISGYPELSAGYDAFYHPDIIAKTAQKLSGFHKVLLLGCANEKMLNYIGTLLEKTNERGIFVLVNEEMQEKIAFKAELFPYHSDGKMDLQTVGEQLEKLYLKDMDCIIIPQYDKVGDYKNIYSIAKTFHLPIYKIDVMGECNLVVC